MEERKGEREEEKGKAESSSSINLSLSLSLLETHSLRLTHMKAIWYHCLE